MDWARILRDREERVDSRTRLAIGGVTTVAASIAVVCAVAMTTSAALVDSAGASIGARPVVVPTSAASPTPIARPSTVPATPPPAALVPAQPETVPAPEPEDIAEPSAAQTAVIEPSAETEQQLTAAVAASGSWDAVYAWADRHGWSQARTEAWIARLDAKIADGRADEAAGEPADKKADEPAEKKADEPADKDADELVAPHSLTGDRSQPLAPAEAEKTSERDLPGPSFGSKRERSQVPPN
jgi:hypothetical protein